MNSIVAALLAAHLFASQVAAYEPPLVFGNVDVTFYCACSKCCGKWAYNRPIGEDGKPIVYGASGNVLVTMQSAACDASVPFGTKFEIELDNGEILNVTCADRGAAVNGAHIDVYVGADKDAHTRALNLGKKRGVAYVLRK